MRSCEVDRRRWSEERKKKEEESGVKRNFDCFDDRGGREEVHFGGRGEA
jgi:hypothetical protein